MRQMSMTWGQRVWKGQPECGCAGSGSSPSSMMRPRSRMPGLGIADSSDHRWKNQYGGMKANDAKKLKELEKENSRLKTIVADLTLDNAMLKELAEGNF